jgi:hypothetical protein
MASCVEECNQARFRLLEGAADASGDAFSIAVETRDDARFV